MNQYIENYAETTLKKTTYIYTTLTLIIIIKITYFIFYPLGVGVVFCKTASEKKNWPWCHIKEIRQDINYLTIEHMDHNACFYTS